MVHSLKITPEHFVEVVTGRKKAEVRLNDRGFAVGDILSLKEFTGDDFTWRYARVRVTHILEGGKYGISPKYVVLSFEMINSVVGAPNDD